MSRWPTLEDLRELGQGREGTVLLLQGAEVMCPKRTLATLSLDLPSCPPEQLVSISTKARRSGRGLR